MERLGNTGGAGPPNVFSRQHEYRRRSFREFLGLASHGGHLDVEELVDAEFIEIIGWNTDVLGRGDPHGESDRDQERNCPHTDVYRLARLPAIVPFWRYLSVTGSAGGRAIGVGTDPNRRSFFPVCQGRRQASRSTDDKKRWSVPSVPLGGAANRLVSPSLALNPGGAAFGEGADLVDGRHGGIAGESRE